LTATLGKSSAAGSRPKGVGYVFVAPPADEYPADRSISPTIARLVSQSLAGPFFLCRQIRKQRHAISN
jgi:hypothetical protein